jgi:hypothetical protein
MESPLNRADSVTGGAGQKLVIADEAQIVDTVSMIFTAALTDDVAKFDSVIASDFYIFDGGAPIDQRFRLWNPDGITAFRISIHSTRTGALDEARPAA